MQFIVKIMKSLIFMTIRFDLYCCIISRGCSLIWPTTSISNKCDNKRKKNKLNKRFNNNMIFNFFLVVQGLGVKWKNNIHNLTCFSLATPSLLLSKIILGGASRSYIPSTYGSSYPIGYARTMDLFINKLHFNGPNVMAW
jgi:hypothetical protein